MIEKSFIKQNNFVEDQIEQRILEKQQIIYEAYTNANDYIQNNITFK